MKSQISLKNLLNSMTLEEKIGQFLQLTPQFFLSESDGEITGPMEEINITEQNIWNAGSILGINNPDDVLKIQKAYLEKSRLGIPLIFMHDIIHGYKTIFPIPLGIACSWDTQSAKTVARVSAVEGSLSGINVTFSPMADLVRDPRWGRVMEATGEDPYLNGLFAEAFVEGYQGEFTDENNIAACVKHFAAYGAPEGGRDYNTVDMSDRTLREYYLPAYKKALDSGAKMVMTSFNIVHGTPATGNSYLMKNILRDEWGFDGVIISDWGAVGELIPHGVAQNGKDAAEQSFNATVDIEMMTSHYATNLKTLIDENKITIDMIDKAVLRILKLKHELGLFENPYKVTSPKKAQEVILNSEHRLKAREVATKSLVLLKNDNVLPFAKNKTVAILGPFADNNDILGQWSCNGDINDTVTLSNAVKEKIGSENVLVCSCPDIYDTTTTDFKKCLDIAKQSDVIILALGEHQEVSGEGGSRAFITLPGVQETFAKEVLALGKPTVSVLFSGRPMEITNLNEVSPAVLCAWFPGTEGGNAIADVLFGDVNPSGRLTMSIPYTIGQIPVYYNNYNTGRPKPETPDTRYYSMYTDIPNIPLYPFGYGLSYTNFEYGKLTVSDKTFSKEKPLTVSTTVKNTGIVEGTETVQFYIKDCVGSVVRPLKELKGYKQINLKPGESQTVGFELTEEMVRFYNFSCQLVSETGEFEVMIGKNSQDIEKIAVTLI